MEKRTNQKKAYALGLAAVCLWSTAATAFKLSLRHLGPEPMVFWASLTSVIVLALVLAVQGRLGELRTLSWTRARFSLILGALNPFLYYLVLIRAYDLLRAQEAQAINYTWAITMSLLSIPLLGQRIRGLQFLAIALSYLGALVISTHGDLLGFRMESPTGFALAMGSTVIWALFWIFGVRDDLDPTLRLFLNFCCGTLYTGVWALLAGFPLTPNLPGLLGAAYIGTFEMGVTFVLWISALRLSQTTAQVSNLIYLAPFLSLFIIHFLVGEAILPSTLVGLGFILAGTAVQKLADRRSGP
ncbi:MAG TPA: EamA family transporter [Desulfomicrobium sp.]|nr:EamA family transporter [Desulfomicrobium sp.]